MIEYNAKIVACKGRSNAATPSAHIAASLPAPSQEQLRHLPQALTFDDLGKQLGILADLEPAQRPSENNGRRSPEEEYAFYVKLDFISKSTLYSMEMLEFWKARNLPLILIVYKY